jgi:hypothetical protein
LFYNPSFKFMFWVDWINPKAVNSCP